MLLRYFKYMLVFSGLCITTSLNAQIDIRVQGSIGNNNVTGSPYFKPSVITTLYIKKNTIEIGGQFNIIDKALPALFIHYGRNIRINKQAFDIHAFYNYHKFSEKLFETNWGLLAGYYTRHFAFKLGTNFRTYHVFKNTQSKIHENFNLMYLAKYYINPSDCKWNIGISITNVDYFLINQETNPMFNIETAYAITPQLKILVEGWYISSGALNLSVNPFGFFFRTACVCKIDY